MLSVERPNTDLVVPSASRPAGLLNALGIIIRMRNDSAVGGSGPCLDGSGTGSNGHRLRRGLFEEVGV